MKKSLNLLVLVSWLSMQTLSMACLNVYGTTVHGHSTEGLDFTAFDRYSAWTTNDDSLTARS